MGGRKRVVRRTTGTGAPASRRDCLRLAALGLAGAVAGCGTPIEPALESLGGSVALDAGVGLVGGRGNHETEEPVRGYVFSRDGGVWREQAWFGAATDRPTHHVGVRVALDGDTAVLGAGTTEHTDIDEAGSAHVFSRSGDGWIRRAELAADEAGSAFGDAVALDGDTALVGAPEETTDGKNGGAAYVFARASGDWERDAKLVAGDGDPRDSFGSAVALDGDTALVGDGSDHTPDGTNAGSVYVFTRADGEWRREAKLRAGDADARDNVGVSVALDGDTALVGAHGDENPNGRRAGAAYVFTRTAEGWTQQAKLAAPNGDRWDRFGASVALDGEIALVGAPKDEGPRPDTAGDTPTEEVPNDTEPRPGNATATDSIAGNGTATGRATENGTATDPVPGNGTAGDPVPGNGTATDRTVSTPENGTQTDEPAEGGPDEPPDRFDEQGDDRGGTVYAFSRTGGEWKPEAELAVNGGERDRFGASVALHGETALVGARGVGGSAYAFDRTDGEWVLRSRFDASPHSTAVAMRS